ncbi:MAG: dTDP-4-dehydrorhamnose 3,5-epimerase family protein, partial [Alphaproteobacteria bacterium]
MRFTATDIDGVLLLETDPIADDRGDFARSFCAEEFHKAGLNFTPVQMNISRNNTQGTLRGMHYQGEPEPDPKVVRCTSGRIYDVAVDLRKDSESFCRWVAAELTPDNQKSLLVPAGCAHGFITLEVQATNKANRREKTSSKHHTPKITPDIDAVVELVGVFVVVAVVVVAVEEL